MVVSALLGGWAAAYAAMAIVAACRRPLRVGEHGAALSRVLIVRPFAGMPNGVAGAMTTMPHDGGTRSLTWVGCIASDTDPAHSHVEAAVAALRARGVSATLQTTGALGPNRKADQIAIATGHHAKGHDAVVIVDADVDLASLDLDALLQPLGGRADDGRTIGLVWSAPHESEAHTTGDRASAAILGASWHSFGVLARLDRHVVMGKAIALRTADLATLDLASLRKHLGEDFELGRRVEAAGMAVHLATTVRSVVEARPLRAVLARYVRWLWVVRAQRPLRLLAYPLLFAAAPLLLLGAMMIAMHDPTMAATIAATTIAARHGIAALATASVRAPARSAFDPWLADALLLAAFVVAWLGRTVRWADRPLTIGQDGLLESPSESP